MEFSTAAALIVEVPRPPGAPGPPWGWILIRLRCRPNVRRIRRVFNADGAPRTRLPSRTRPQELRLEVRYRRNTVQSGFNSCPHSGDEAAVRSQRDGAGRASAAGCAYIDVTALYKVLRRRIDRRTEVEKGGSGSRPEGSRSRTTYPSSVTRQRRRRSPRGIRCDTVRWAWPVGAPAWVPTGDARNHRESGAIRDGPRSVRTGLRRCRGARIAPPRIRTASRRSNPPGSRPRLLPPSWSTSTPPG